MAVRGSRGQRSANPSAAGDILRRVGDHDQARRTASASPHGRPPAGSTKVWSSATRQDSNRMRVASLALRSEISSQRPSSSAAIRRSSRRPRAYATAVTMASAAVADTAHRIKTPAVPPGAAKTEPNATSSRPLVLALSSTSSISDGRPCRREHDEERGNVEHDAMVRPDASRVNPGSPTTSVGAACGAGSSRRRASRFGRSGPSPGRRARAPRSPARSPACPS